MKHLLFFSISLFLIACGQNNSDTSAPAAGNTNTPVGDFSAFDITDIPGSDIKRARRIDEKGQLVDEGFLLNNQKTGTWTTYYTSQKVKTLTNYVAGKKNGIMIELSDRSQVNLQAFYLNDQLDGRHTKFGFGRKLEEEAHYKNGKLHGVFRSYDNKGNVNREIHYKDGKLHGPNIFFNEGVKTVEYEYKDGEKISGGIVK